MKRFAEHYFNWGKAQKRQHNHTHARIENNCNDDAIVRHLWSGMASSCRRSLWSHCAFIRILFHLRRRRRYRLKLPEVTGPCTHSSERAMATATATTTNRCWWSRQKRRLAASPRAKIYFILYDCHKTLAIINDHIIRFFGGSAQIVRTRNLWLMKLNRAID